MIGNNIKKEKEFQSIKPIMKVLGYNAQEARDLLIESEKPDFILKYGNKTVGIEVTECHPEITEGKGAKNLMAAMQRTREICNFIEKLQDAKGEEVNYRLCFTFALLFDLQKSKLRRLEKERILGEVYAEMQNRIINGDFLVLGDDYQKLHKEWAKPYHYIRDIIIDKPLEKSIITYSYPNKGLFPIEHENIIKAISRKEAKFVSYQKIIQVLMTFGSVSIFQWEQIVHYMGLMA